MSGVLGEGSLGCITAVNGVVVGSSFDHRDMGEGRRDIHRTMVRSTVTAWIGHQGGSGGSSSASSSIDAGSGIAGSSAGSVVCRGCEEGAWSHGAHPQ